MGHIWISFLFMQMVSLFGKIYKKDYLSYKSAFLSDQNYRLSKLLGYEIP